MFGGIRQRLDDLELLDDRARPAVRDDDRQRAVVLRAHVDEVNVEPVDLRDELRERIQPRFDFAPVVLRAPVRRERLHRGELHALRIVRDQLAIRPPRRLDAPIQIGELCVRRLEMKRTDGSAFSRRLDFRHHVGHW